MSRYWDLLHKGKTESELSELMKKIDVVTVLSGICIDLAKKMFDVNINKEIEHICQTDELKKEKPLFWKYVSQDGNLLTEKYECPMDFLFEEMSELDWADYRKDRPFESFLVEFNRNNGDRKQELKVLNYVENMVTKINNVYIGNFNDDERDRRIDDIIKYYKFFVDKLKINNDTMYSLMMKLSKNKRGNVASRLLSVLHGTQKSVFFKAFLTKNSTI
jgi:hypothetical protein